MTTVEPPMAYLGGKGRLADLLAPRILAERTGGLVFDLCCGSGAVSLGLLRAGLSPSDLVMADLGWWGEFWRQIGAGAFDMPRFLSLLRALPSDPVAIHDAVQALARSSPAPEDQLGVFLLMQAASFGGKPVPSDPARWPSHTFRRYWLPTETSSRRSPVNPMMPMPATLEARVLKLVAEVVGVVGIRGDVRGLCIPPGSVVYVDPPYEGLTGYGASFDVVTFARQVAASGSVVLVSEAKALGEEAILMSEGRAKGGVSGVRRSPNPEWLTIFRAHERRGCS